MSKLYSIAKARDQLAELVHRAERGTPVELTRHGKRVAVIVSTKAYEDLVQRLPGLWDSIERFRQSADLVAAELGPDAFEDVRDRSSGRKVKL